MTDIAVTSARVAPVHPSKAKIFTYIAGAALSAGDVVYVNSAGKVAKADANGTAPANTFRGIALETVGSGQAVDILIEGHVAGFTVSGLAYDAAVYVSDTAGALADAASSTTSLLAGRVVPLTDKDLTKVLYITGWAG